MTSMLIFNCLLIVAARLVDVALGTLRSVSVIRGMRGAAWAFGFFEVLVWISVASRVIPLAQEQPIYAVFYAVGFATGNFLGITIEQALAFGEQAVRIFTRAGHVMADALRDEDFAVTEFDGRGRDGPVAILFIHTPRKRVRELIRRARQIDPACFYTVDDVRVAGTAMLTAQSPGFWRGIMQRR